MDYSQHFSVNKSKQGSPIPGREADMKQNYDGAYVFNTGKWTQLERFLFIGTEGGTYYAGESELTKENATNTIKCIEEDGVRVVDLIVDISITGRAPKNDPAIFALALVCAFGDEKAKKAAYEAISKVCRIGTHLFNFMNAIQNLRGWSRGLKNGVAKYYNSKDDSRLELDLLKYKGRNGFTHRDVLRLAHIKPKTETQDSLFSIAANKGPKLKNHPVYNAMEFLKELASNGVNKDVINKTVAIITEHKLPRELVPNELLNSKEVWEALLQSMPMTALMRNLGKMSSIGLLGSTFSNANKLVVEKLGNVEALKRARIHPVNVLNTLATYSAGRGLKGSLQWEVNGKIKGALEEAFYNSFQFVEPTGKNIMLGLDISGSMTWGGCGGTALTPRQIEAAMAMTFVRTEQNVDSVAFCRRIKSFPLSRNMSLNEVMTKMNNMSFGNTNCGAPIQYAIDNKLPIDAFIIMTDNETNARYAGHASVLIKRLRQLLGRDVKMVVAGFTATSSSIADPKDPGMIDIVGFDSAIPKVVSNFIR